MAQLNLFVKQEKQEIKTYKVKSLEEVQAKLLEYKNAEKENCMPCDTNTIRINILERVVKCWNEEECIKYWQYLDEKYTPYLNGEVRKKAKEDAEKYLETEYRKTQNKEKREKIMQTYEKMLPPEYDRYIWTTHEIMKWICSDGELLGPILRNCKGSMLVY